MIAIVDYGVGNLFSLKSSLKYIGNEAVVTGDAAVIRDSERIIFPGVGAFGDAAEKLRETGLGEVVKEEAKKGKLILGICLGMQLLFEKGFEYGEHEGLGLIPGEVREIAPVVGEGLKVPQMGWNYLHFPECRAKSPLYRYVEEGEYVYFVHSYAGMNCDASVTALTEYGAWLTASVQRENVLGTQFHPEKSGKTGLAILKAFCEMQ